MAAVVDRLSYPFSEPIAQELHLALCRLYPTSKAAMYMAGNVGLNTFTINPEQAPLFVWMDVLNAGAVAGRNRALVTLARDQQASSPLAPLLDAVLADAPVALDRQPRKPDGSPKFLKGSDAVTEKEALLFHDDLTLAIGRIPWLIGVLGMLKELGPGVCKLQVARFNSSQKGSGFRIGHDLLLTNEHVLQIEGLPPTSITAEFGYEDDGEGGVVASTAIPCDVASVIWNFEDDWAIVRVKEALPKRVPALKLSEAVDPVQGSPAFVIQHPGGERKRIAYVRNDITDFDDQVVHYLSDTQYGSSGSPVLNDKGQLVALHHAGGSPQEAAGKPPLQKNEGIRIPRVVEGLKKLGIEFA